MIKTETLKSELAFYGVSIDDKQITLFEDGEKKKLPLPQGIQYFQTKIQESKTYLQAVWKELSRILDQKQITEDHEESLERLFLVSIKHLRAISEDNKELKSISSQIDSLFNKDIAELSSQLLDGVVEARMAIDWMQYTVRLHTYQYNLLKAYQMSTRDIKEVLANSNSGGPWNNLDMPEEERHGLWDSWEKPELEGRDRWIRDQQRYNMEDWREPEPGVPGTFNLFNTTDGSDPRTQPYSADEIQGPDSPYPNDRRYSH